MNSRNAATVNGLDRETRRALRERYRYTVVLRSIRVEDNHVHILAYVVKEAGFKDHASYVVRLILSKPDLRLVKASCSCPGWALRGKCKHIAMVYLEARKLLQ